MYINYFYNLNHFHLFKFTMDDKVLKNKLDALKNSRKFYDAMRTKQNSKSSSKPKTDKSNGMLKDLHDVFNN